MSAILYTIEDLKRIIKIIGMSDKEVQEMLNIINK